jgi:myosin V
MQSRKSDADVDSICEICPSLTGSQILKLIKSYTSDDCEDAISSTFIDKLAKKLNAVRRSCVKVRTDSNSFIRQPENEIFTMNENEIKPLSVVFKYSSLKLEDIELPDVLKLNGLVTKI